MLLKVNFDLSGFLFFQLGKSHNKHPVLAGCLDSVHIHRHRQGYLPFELAITTLDGMVVFILPLYQTFSFTVYDQNISADNDYDLARLALEQAMNMKDMGVIDVADDFKQRIVYKDLDSCLTIAMENRPDLKMSEFTVKSTEYGQKIDEVFKKIHKQKPEEG